MNLEKIKKLNLPASSGVYLYYNKAGRVIYIGKAANLKARIISYWQKSTSHSPAKLAMLKEITKVKWQETESEIEAILLEANLIKKYQPKFNVLLRDDKRFLYLKVSLEDEIPGLFITRKIDRAGRYFGPFTSAQAIRETVRAIRKIFPYCNQRKISTKPCFYYQLGRCLGVCGGLVSRQEYLKKVIKPLVLFLQGKKTKIVKELEKEIKKRESGLKRLAITNPVYQETIEKINNLKYQLNNFKQVLEHAKIISLADKYTADVVELAKLLALPKAPERIEGYDIANLPAQAGIFRRAAVGSMVVFSGGEPDKNEYRKFKIRIGPAFASSSATSSAKASEVKKAMVDKEASAGKPTYAKALVGKRGDVQMLEEMLERRFKHTSTPLTRGARGVRGITPLIKGVRGIKYNPPHPPYPTYAEASAGKQGGGKESWPLPDLIIIDGGKAQLNAALRVMKTKKLEIPVIAISKGQGLRSAHAPDKLFFPGQTKPLELPLASPALHLLKRVRDEAHRFAVGYHRKLRGKAFKI